MKLDPVFLLAPKVPAGSDAIQWSIAQSIPMLDMALIEGHPSETIGEVSVHLAHVIRLDYQ